MDPDTLLERARAAREQAYAPYSRYRVGAAIATADGSVFTGSNVENASYGLTICAERAAVAAAVGAGHRDFASLALVTGGEEAVAPCGACRQVLAEFAPDLRVYAEAGGRRREWSLAELLPARFAGPGDMDERDSNATSVDIT